MRFRIAFSQALKKHFILIILDIKDKSKYINTVDKIISIQNRDDDNEESLFI